MKYYIIAGEASGDLHGGNLIKELMKQDPTANVRCWGGDKMQDAGGVLVKHFRELAFMGFVEVVKNIGTILRNISLCKKDIQAYKPDVLILIDYPGFNLRIAKWAKLQGLQVVYYISPQVWAWKEGRVRMMKECIDKMLVILPFEKQYFKSKWDWEVEYVGHPLIEEVERKKAEKEILKLADKPIIALLPGSRRQEIKVKLPVMLEVSKAFPHHQFIVAKAPGVEEAFYDEMLQPYSNVSYVSNQTYNLLVQAEAALVTSGTATLETALFGVPEVVCYKGSPISYQIARRVIKVKYISLVNLIMDKLVVRELIQHEMTTQNLVAELTQLLQNEEKKRQLKTDYARLYQLLAAGGYASAKAAGSIVALLQQ